MLAIRPKWLQQFWGDRFRRSILIDMTSPRKKTNGPFSAFFLQKPHDSWPENWRLFPLGFFVTRLWFAGHFACVKSNQPREGKHTESAIISRRGRVRNKTKNILRAQMFKHLWIDSLFVLDSLSLQVLLDCVLVWIGGDREAFMFVLELISG